MSEENEYSEYEELCQTTPENIRKDPERFLKMCRAAEVKVPLFDRFFVKNHTPRKSPRNPDPQPTDYVVIPHPKGGRDLWVDKNDFPALLQAANQFGESIG